jgi:predicted enzyme related to lactoylglutathione lyase
MLERDGFPPGVPCWVDTAQPDVDAAAHFYGGVFGWEFDDRMPPDAPGQYLIARLDGRDVAAVGSGPDDAGAAPVWNTYIGVDDADATAAKITNAGARVVNEPFDVFDAGRMAVCADSAGATFCLWQAQNHKGAQLVNAPGTWNFSDLNTREPEGAQAFYGAVFGWETTSMDLGDGRTSTFWRVPGYGKFLQQFDPDLLTRQADVHAPEGFEDAVAWLVPMTSDQLADDAPPHWSVAFAVADTDATVATAIEFGGDVVVPTFDAPYVRTAVLRDPQGAVFTASAFVPPT